MKTIAIVAALLLAGVVVPAFGQVAQPQQLPDTTIPTQCIDLNQDRVCEAVVLANGTMMNFTKPAIVEITDQTTGKCQGFQNTPTFCKTLKMPSGEIVLNKTLTYGCNADQYQANHNCIDNYIVAATEKPASETQTQTQATEETTTWIDPTSGLVYDIPTQGYYCLDFDEDYVCDVDFNNGKMVIYGESEADQETATTTEDEPARESGNDNDEVNPYCDKVNYEVDCWDRKDYSQTTGLYPCNDGSNRGDWRDCPDASDYDYESNNDENPPCIGQSPPPGADECYDTKDLPEDSGYDEDTGGSNPEGEEEDQSCGGESCTDDEKEDSTTDEEESDAEYYEEGSVYEDESEDAEEDE